LIPAKLKTVSINNSYPIIDDDTLILIDTLMALNSL